ncbi:hypothetical protein KC333_g47 [Hortaea werneckii]|nr:hypothetical protein KC333_g47 [Hortaea werneckii]
MCRRCLVGTLSPEGAVWSSLNAWYLPHRLLLPFTSFDMATVLDFPILTSISPVPSILPILGTRVVDLRFAMYLRKPLGWVTIRPGGFSP